MQYKTIKSSRENEEAKIHPSLMKVKIANSVAWGGARVCFNFKCEKLWRKRNVNESQ
jgi:hypothetical protein